MDRYPLMIFRAPGAELHHGVSCDTLVVHDDDEFDDALEQGWRKTPAEAAAVTTAEQDAAAAALHAEVLAQEQQAAEEAAAAIRAPLLAEIASLTAQLDAAKAAGANTVQRLHEEETAHAATRAQLAAALEPKTGANETPAKTGKAKG